MTNKETHARITDQLYLNIRWARVFENTDSPRKAQFSGDLCLNDGTKICSINRLCVINTLDSNGEPAIFIGSMSEVLSQGDTLYSVSWFPNAKYDKADLKMRTDFAKECVRAIEAFQVIDLEKKKKHISAKTRLHPSLKGMTDTAAKIRSLMGV